MLMFSGKMNTAPTASETTSWLNNTQQTQNVESMLVYRWSSVVDGVPALNQHWFNALCLLVTLIFSLAQRWPKARFISFHFIFSLFPHDIIIRYPDAPQIRAVMAKRVLGYKGFSEKESHQTSHGKFKTCLHLSGFNKEDGFHLKI